MSASNTFLTHWWCYFFNLRLIKSCAGEGRIPLSLYHLLHRPTLSYQAIWIKTGSEPWWKICKAVLVEQGYLQVSQMGLGLLCTPQTLSSRLHPQCHCEPHRYLLVRDPCYGWSTCGQADLYGLSQIRTKGWHWKDVRIEVKSTSHAIELRKQVQISWQAGLDTMQVYVCVRQILSYTWVCFKTMNFI